MPPLTTTEADQPGGTDADLGRLPDELRRRGLAAPAALLLDAHRPLLPLLRQVGIFSSPLIGSLIGVRRMAGLQRLLDESHAFDRLISRLEERQQQRDDR
jgi:hypothetical protein